MSTPKQHLIEISPPTVHAVRVAGSMVEFYRACPLDQKPALDDLLAGWTEGAPVRASTLISPPSARWHLATREETQRHRTLDALRKYAGDMAADVTGPLDIIGCNADDGQPLATSGTQRWLLGASPTEAVDALLAQAKERGLDGARPGCATLARIGGIVAALRAAGSGQVLIWDIGVDRSHAILVASRGVEAVTPCPVGFDALCGIIQAALGLKFRAAAARLFFNESYDFSEAAPKIAAEIAPALKPALAAVGGNAGTALACTGLTAKQSWLAAEVARVLGIPIWAPDVAKTLGTWKLQLSAHVSGGLSVEALGLVRLAAGTQPPKDWYPVWVRAAAAAPAPESAAKPTEKPVLSTPVASAAPAKGASPAEKVAAPPPASASSAAPVAAKALTPAKAASTPSPKPEQKSAVAPVKPAAAESKPGPKSPAKPAAEKPPAAPAGKKPGSRPPVELVVSYPSHEKRRPNFTLYGGIAAGVVFAAIATKFYFDAQSAKATVEREKAVAAEQLKQAEARQHQVELRAKAEAEQIRKEAEAAREAAVALARQQAEEQTRIKVSAALEAERIALSPGILVVTTSPAGADVSIDGGAKRKAPLSLNDMAPGAHQVSISLAGYEAVTLRAEIKGTKTTDLGLIQLERATGTLVVTSAPGAVDFAIRPAAGDPKAAPVRNGRTPAQFTDLPPGDYTVTFSRDGWSEHREKVTVAKRQSVEVATKFSDGVVGLTSSPVGATVKRDGISLGVTPLTLNGVNPGKVSYEFSLAGYDPITVTGDVPEGQRVNLSASLPSLDRIASTAEVKTPPKPFSTPAPRLPMMQRNDEQLKVNVSFVVNRDGTLRDIQTVGKVDKQLGKTCIEAISKWKFQPAMGYDGRPLNVRVSIPITFVTQDS